MTPDELNSISAQVRDELESAIEPLAGAYERLLRRAGRRMSRHMKAQATTLTAATIVPPDEDEVIPASLRTDVEKMTKTERAKLARLLAVAYGAHEIAFDIEPVLTEELLEKVGTHAAFATEQELRTIYRDVIQRGAVEGMSVPDTAREIVNAVDDVAGYRATALARTDLIGLANGAGQNAATKAFAGREDVVKVWLATPDDRTRESHVDANGQRVALNEYFDVDGFPMMYPGDPDGPDEEVINCRCTVIYSGRNAQEQEAAAAAIAASALSVSSGVYPARQEVSMTDELTAANVTVTVNGEAVEVAEETRRVPWEGILAIEGAPTSDGRYLLPGEIGARDLPLPLAASHEDQHLTETVGRIEIIEHIPLAEFAREGWELSTELPDHAVVIWAEGTFDGSPAAKDALRAMENGVGISLDLPMDRQAIIDAVTYQEVDPKTLDEEDLLGIMFGMMPDGYLRGIAGKIGGASLASIAAFEETSIRIVEDHALVASGYVIREREVGVLVNTFADVEALLASAAPIAPPRDWFFMEEPDEPTPLTILPTGQFYVHLALWNTCHAGRANGAYASCMYAPHSPSRYAQFHLGALVCDDGSEVAIGRLTIGTGHAPLNLNAAAARKHYDHTGTCVAYARAYDGVFGIWLCGAIRSDATEEQIRDFRACPPSGDWRTMDGMLELQAALAVNVAGFPVPRSQLALNASAESLEIASLILGAPDESDRMEALRAEVDLRGQEDVNMLVELGADEFVQRVARSLAK